MTERLTPHQLDALVTQIVMLPVGAIFYVHTTDNDGGDPPVVYERASDSRMRCIVGKMGETSTFGPFNIETNVPPHWTHITRPGEERCAQYHMLMAHGLYAKARDAIRGITHDR